MKKVFGIIAVAAAFTMLGCSSASTKTSPLDGQWQGKGKSFSYKKFVKPMKWAAGQYVITGTIKDGEKESVNKILIVGKENGGWIFETITTNADNEITGMQMLIQGYESAIAKNDASQIKVEWIKILQKDGTIQKTEGDGMMIYNMMLKSTWNNVIMSANNSTSGGAITVPAGTFAGTTQIATSVKILFSTINQTSYLHPDIPVNGVVKSISDDTITELIDFGFNGKATIK